MIPWLKSTWDLLKWWPPHSRKYYLSILILKCSFTPSPAVYSVTFFKYWLPPGNVNIITKTLHLPGQLLGLLHYNESWSSLEMPASVLGKSFIKPDACQKPA